MRVFVNKRFLAPCCLCGEEMVVVDKGSLLHVDMVKSNFGATYYQCRDIAGKHIELGEDSWAILSNGKFIEEARVQGVSGGREREGR